FASLIFNAPKNATRWAGAMSAFGKQIESFDDWGVVGFAIVASGAALLMRRQWKPVLQVLALTVPMIVLYAAIFAVTPWKLTDMSFLAPRLLTDFIGPGLYLVAAAASAIPDV